MTESNTTEIPLNKTNLLTMLPFAIGFVVAGLWLLIAQPETSSPLLSDPVYRPIIAYVAILIGVFSMYVTARLIKKKTGLVINEQGVWDNVGHREFGVVPWSDITAIYEHSISTTIASRQRFVVIKISNPDKYVPKISNPFRRQLLKMNTKSDGHLMHLTISNLKTTQPELLGILRGYFIKYKTDATAETL